MKRKQKRASKETIEWMRKSNPHWDKQPEFIKNLALYGEEDPDFEDEDEEPAHSKPLRGLKRAVSN